MVNMVLYYEEKIVPKVDYNPLWDFTTDLGVKSTILTPEPHLNQNVKEVLQNEKENNDHYDGGRRDIDRMRL